MTEVPASLRDNTESLCRRIRQGTGEPPLCYREFIRNNLSEVIGQSFPLFNAAVSAEQRADSIEGFLAKHRAQEPEYHHIATEFVRYMQTSLAGQPLRLLLEYEWVLLCTEISSAPVSATTHYSSDGVLLTSTVQLNPTLICIEVPFTLDNGQVITEPEGHKKRYALYRNTGHQVLSLQLNDRDIALLNTLSQNEIVPVSKLLNKTERQIPRTVLLNWLEKSIENQIILMTP